MNKKKRLNLFVASHFSVEFSVFGVFSGSSSKPKSKYFFIQVIFDHADKRLFRLLEQSRFLLNL